MKRYSIKMLHTKFIIYLAAFLLINLEAFSQTDPPAFDTNTQDLVPLDGGLSLLLAAGVALGAKKAYQYRKDK